MADYALSRQMMVEGQLRRRGVRDERVLAAIRKVPRHEFVGESLRHQAYDDHPLPIGEGQTISQPYMVGAMTEALQVAPEHRVLEIGTGSGYQAAVLAELCRTVYSVEFLPGLSQRARLVLNRLGYHNIRLRVGNGQEGWPEFAPFDRVLVTAGAETMPRRLVQQLVDGGRIVVPVAGVLTVGVKHGERLVQRALFGCVFVPFVDPGQKAGRS